MCGGVWRGCRGPARPAPAGAGAWEPPVLLRGILEICTKSVTRSSNTPREPCVLPRGAGVVGPPRRESSGADRGSCADRHDPWQPLSACADRHDRRLAAAMGLARRESSARTEPEQEALACTHTHTPQDPHPISGPSVLAREAVQVSSRCRGVVAENSGAQAKQRRTRTRASTHMRTHRRAARRGVVQPDLRLRAADRLWTFCPRFVPSLRWGHAGSEAEIIE